MCRTLWLFAIASSSSLSIAPCVRAQWAYGLEVPWQSRIDRSDVDEILEALQITEDQKAIIQTIYADHVTAFKMVAEAGRQAEQELQTQRDACPPASLEAQLADIRLAKEIAVHADKQAEIDSAFFENVQAVLSDDRLAAWEEYLRAGRWERLSQFAQNVPGSKVNLHTVINDLQLRPHEAEPLQPLLAEYDTIMDGLLEAMFDAEIRQHRRKWRRLEQVMAMNAALEHVATPEEYESVSHAKGRRMSREHREALRPQIAVRQSNHTFADLIQTVLADASPERAVDFRKAFNLAKHIDTYAASQSLAHIHSKRILQLDDLTQEQKESIAATISGLDAALEKINDQIAAAEEELFRQQWSRPRDSEAHGRIRDKIEGLKRERDVRASATKDRLLALLSQEQQRQLTAQGANSRR